MPLVTSWVLFCLRPSRYLRPGVRADAEKARKPCQQSPSEWRLQAVDFRLYFIYFLGFSYYLCAHTSCFYSFCQRVVLHLNSHHPNCESNVFSCFPIFKKVLSLYLFGLFRTIVSSFPFLPSCLLLQNVNSV